MTEVTKSCVRVLRFERKIRNVCKIFITSILFIITSIIKFIFIFINGCILRACARWFGFPIMCVSIWFLFTTAPVMPDGSHEFTGFGGMCFLIATISFVIFLYSWIEIPDAEQRILTGEVK